MLYKYVSNENEEYVWIEEKILLSPMKSYRFARLSKYVTDYLKYYNFGNHNISLLLFCLSNYADTIFCIA